MRLSFLIKVARLILWRSWRTTMVLTLTVISAVSALVFLSALAVGTNDAMISNSTGLYSGHIIGDKLQEGELHRLQTAGVSDILVRKHQRLLLQNKGNLEPVELVGIHPEQEKKATALWNKTIEGRFPLPGEETIFVSRSTAAALKLAAGDAVTLVDRSGVALKNLIVAGIYRTGISYLDQGLAFCPVEALPAEKSRLSVAVFLRPGVEVDSVAARYRKALPGANFSSWPEFMPDLNQLIELNYLCMALVIILVFAIVSIGISCTFLIFTLKNLREHGVMKAMGTMSTETALLILSQIGLLTLIAAALGTLIGIAAVMIFAHIGIDISAFTSHNQYFSVSGILYPRLTAGALFAPPSMAILFSLIAAIWPIVSICRKNPADILRSV